MAGILAVAIHGSTVVAAMITFQFGGVITSVSDAGGALGGDVNVGDPFSGTYTFDPDTPDGEPADPSRGLYEPLGALMTLSAGSVTVVSGPSALHAIVVEDNWLGLRDLFLMGGYSFESGSLSVGEMEIRLSDPTQTAFDSDGLPLTPPVLTSFTTRTLIFQGRGSFDVRGELTTLTPEPTAMLLILIAGFLVLPRKHVPTR
jgi:hypothetical protein